MRAVCGRGSACVNESESGMRVRPVRSGHEKGEGWARW